MKITKEQAARCTTHHFACDCREYNSQEDWREVYSLILDISMRLMSVGTKRNVSEEWYNMVDKLIGRCVEVIYRNITDKEPPK